MLSLDTNGIFHELTLVYKCVYLFLPLASLSVQLEGSVSCDLTANSFGKALAHVRNCLLMKKMCIWHKSYRGRTKHWRILHYIHLWEFVLTDLLLYFNFLHYSASAFPNEFAVRSHEYCAGKHWYFTGCKKIKHSDVFPSF
jgi:hypothetical protein